MNFSRSTLGAKPATSAPHELSDLRSPDEEAAHPPRWGLLAAAILAALVTATWIGSAFSAAQPAAAAAASAAAPVK